MTDLAEPRALEPPIVIANRLHSRAAVYTEEGRHNAWGQLMLDGEATILSLIAEVERLRGERTVEIGAALSHWNLAAEKIKQDRQAAFRRGIEAAAAGSTDVRLSPKTMLMDHTSFDKG